MHCVWCWKIKNGVFVCVRAQGDNFGRFASQFHSHSPEIMDITEGHYRWKESSEYKPYHTEGSSGQREHPAPREVLPFGQSLKQFLPLHSALSAPVTDIPTVSKKKQKTTKTTTNPTNKNWKKILLLYTYWTRFFRLRAIWAFLKIQGDMLYINIYFSAQSLFLTPHHLKDVQLYACRRIIYFR